MRVEHAIWTPRVSSGKWWGHFEGVHYMDTEVEDILFAAGGRSPWLLGLGPRAKGPRARPRAPIGAGPKALQRVATQGYYWVSDTIRIGDFLNSRVATRGYY